MNPWRHAVYIPPARRVTPPARPRAPSYPRGILLLLDLCLACIGLAMILGLAYFVALLSLIIER